jgi:signal transduction histidine kinase
MSEVDADRVVVPALTVGAVLLAVLTDPGSPWETAALVVAGVALVARVAFGAPLPVTVPLVLLGVAGSLWTGHLESGLFLLSLLALVLAGWEPITGLVVALLGATFAVPPVLAALRPETDFSTGIWMLGIAFPAALGWGVGRQLTLARQLADARLALAEQAILDERRRIARDVHDMVGHGLAATLVQIASARHVLRRDPDAADEALGVAERVGRSSMQELRATLSLLRDADAPEVGALPGAEEISGLVEAARATGLRVSLRVVGDLARLDRAVGLTLHRIAQEALTNASRHAPGAETVMVLDASGSQARLDVLSRGTSGPDDPDPRGRFGIRGMAERAEAVGGSLSAGPSPEGWLVRAVIPLVTP